MNKTDYSFMKTGANTLESNENLNQVEKSQLLSVMTVFMENALFIAERFVIFEKRQEITDKDIILALKSQALDHTEIWDTDETKNKLSKLYGEIYQELNENFEENEVESEDIEEEIEKRTLTQMSIEDYNKVKEIDSRWINWSPIDSESILIKKAIDNTESKFNN